MERYLVCMTGASGSIYGLRLLRALCAMTVEVHLVASAWGSRVVAEETGRGLESWLGELGPGRVEIHSPEDLASPLASGSFRLDGTVIVPASMGSVGALATGNVRNLVHRAGAVALKEGWPLVVVPRESPLSLVDLKNLVSLAEAGAAIMPASPAFYHCPKDIDALVDDFLSRILDRLGVPNNLARPWEGSRLSEGGD
jgi:4-hydroxy-3-polyprenylbenzoate decarboxylase